MHPKTPLLGTALLALAASTARAESWEIDPAHSSAQFAIRHLLVSNVRGDFGKITGHAEYDGKLPTKAMLEAVIDVASIDTRNSERDAHLKSPDFFDVASYPTITFKSKKVQATGKGKLAMVGDLTLHGVTKEITLDVQGPAAEVKDPRGHQRIGAAATAKLRRKDFGLTWNKTIDAGGLALSDEVSITLEIELIRKPTSAAAARP